METTEASSVVVLVGRTGSGKSSLLLAHVTACINGLLQQTSIAEEGHQLLHLDKVRQHEDAAAADAPRLLKEPLAVLEAAGAVLVSAGSVLLRPAERVRRVRGGRRAPRPHAERVHGPPESSATAGGRR